VVNRGTIRPKKHWYEHVPKSLETSRGGKIIILWYQVQTDRTIPNNKPDIVIRDNEKGTCMLIDIAIPGDRNMIHKEAKKILKYNRTSAYVECKNKGDTVSKSFRRYVSTIPGNNEVRELQKTHIGHCTHTTKSADIKVHQSQRRN
jgi:hypothetical protein